MRGIILTSLGVSLALAAAWIYDEVTRRGASFSPTSLLAISGFVAWALFSLTSLTLYRTRWRPAVVRLWLMAVSVFLTYAALDAAAGILLIRPLSPPMLPDEVVHHKLVPSSLSHYRTRDYRYDQQANNLGLRGPDVEPVKKQGTYRLLMLGDSFTMGKGVGDHETFSVLLEESLNSKPTLAGPVTFEVLNAGVDSYAPILSFLQLTRIAELLEPDLAVLNLDMSDLIQEAAYRTQATYSAVGELVGVPADGETVKIHRAAAARAWIDKNLYFTRLILFYMDKTAGKAGAVTVHRVVTTANRGLVQHTLAEDNMDRQEQWRGVFESILKAQRYCANRGIRFFLTIYPWGHQVSESEWVPGRWAFVPKDAVLSSRSVDRIEEFAAANDVDLLNMFPAFRAYDEEAPLYFSHDMHWTPAGHVLAAREYDRFLRETIFTVPIEDHRERARE